MGQEFIPEGTITQKKKERDRGNDKHSNLYIVGLDHEIDALSLVKSYLRMIKRNAPLMADKVVTKMYCSGKRVG